MSATATSSGRLVDFARGLRLDDVPADVQRLARLHIADALGVGLGASAAPAHRRWLEGLRAQAGSGPATVLGFADGAPAATAALLNGTSIHSLEYDDTHMASIVHGSAVIVPAALAAVESGQGTLDELVRLAVIGWEALVRIGEASPGGFQRRGFQVTSVGGVLVAALLASIARAASAAEARSAMGIAGSQAGGLFEFLRNASTVKAMHPGWAAHAGWWAAASAAAGMTGPDTVLEGGFGLYRAYADDGEAGERLRTGLDDLGTRWRLADAAFKLHPCCHYIHPYLECAAALRQALATGAGGASGPDVAAAIESVECAVAPGAATVICEPWAAKQRVETGKAAQYSLPVCLALALLGRPVDLAAMTAATVAAEARELAGRIDWTPWTDSGFPRRFGARVSVRLRDGRVLEHRVAQVAGSAERPAQTAAVRAKFEANAGVSLAGPAVAALWEAVTGGSDLGAAQRALRSRR